MIGNDNGAKDHKGTVYSLTDRIPGAPAPVSPSDREARELAARKTDGPKPCRQDGCLIPVEEHGGASHVHENYDAKMAVHAERQRAREAEVARLAARDSVTVSVDAKLSIFSTFTPAEAAHFKALLDRHTYEPASKSSLLGLFAKWGLQ